MFELPKEKFISIFLNEAGDVVAELESDLLELENNNQDDELINKIFRAVHTLKGSAGTVGLDNIRDFTHSVENLLEKVRSGKMEITREIIDITLKYLDITKVMLEHLENGGDDEKKIEGMDELTARVKELLGEESGEEDPAQKLAQKAKSGGPKRFFLSLKYKDNIFEHGIDPLMFIRELEQKTTIKELRVNKEDIDLIPELDPFYCYTTFELIVESFMSHNEITDIFIFVLDDNEINITELQPGEEAPFTIAEEDAADISNETDANDTADNATPAESSESSENEEQGKGDGAEGKATEPEKKAPETATAASTVKKKSSAASTVRVSTEKLDSMMNLVGELVIAQSRIMQTVKQLAVNDNNELNNAVLSLDRITREIQEEVMNIRMMPIAPIFMQFQRFVRDVSRDLGKDIKLDISGEQTEIDKNMLEQLSDPLKHIIRNSIDHGVEGKDEREKNGKDPQGTINLSAYHQEGHVVIEIIDDGRGLNKEKLYQKGLERGLFKQDGEYSDKDIYNIIFAPGLSTAEKVSDISGRGVGMDVVRTNIEKLKGRIEVESKQNEGTKIRLRLPLTLAIIEGITCSIGENIFVMPLLSIVENIRVNEDDIRSIENKEEMVNIRGEYYPLIRLHKLFSTQTEVKRVEDGIVIMAETGYRRVVVFVDELLDQQQFVIKSLDPAFKKHAGVAGACILGDGRIALILDVAGLVNTVSDTAKAEAAELVEEKNKEEEPVQ